jgi:ankyrin repeat protein
MQARMDRSLRSNRENSCDHPLHRTWDLEAWRQYFQAHPPSKKPWDERDANENFHSVSSLYQAIDQGKEDIVAFLIENNIVTPNTESFFETPLLRAVTKKNVMVAKTLLDLGAEKDAFGCAVS